MNDYIESKRNEDGSTTVYLWTGATIEANVFNNHPAVVDWEVPNGRCYKIIVDPRYDTMSVINNLRYGPDVPIPF